MKFRLRVVFLIAFGLMFTLAGCFGSSEPEVDASFPTRTPHPTFTPTPPVPTATLAPATVAPAGTGQGGAVAGTESEKPIAVVNDELVNIRQGPGTDQPIIVTASRGEQFDLIGKNPEEDWWQVCCVDGVSGWIFYAYVDTNGPVDTVPVAGGEPTATPAPSPTSAPVALPPTQPPAPAEVAQPVPPTDTPAPTVPPTPTFPFNLVAQERFPESNNLVRIFLYVYQGDQALEGYTLRVTKDGAELPVSAISSANAGFTWPVANPRQRFQNMKVEFNNVQAGGTWEVQLVDGSGNPAGPAATFTLIGADTDRELYVRYEKP